jgi:hypothetical protein
MNFERFVLRNACVIGIRSSARISGPSSAIQVRASTVGTSSIE